MHPAEKLAQWYAGISPSNLAEIKQFYAPNARFKDPFNDVVGIAQIEKIFVHMFASTTQPRFVFQDFVLQEQQAFLTWEFHFGLRGKQYTVIGGSHLFFDQQGRVITHRDYWDVAEELWQKIPVLGVLVRFLRRRFMAVP